VSFGGQHQFSGVMIEAIEFFARVDVVIGSFTDYDFFIARVGVDDANFFAFRSTLIVVVHNCLTIWKPLEPRTILEGQFLRSAFNVNTLSRLNVENDGLRLRQYLAWQWIGD